VPRCDCAGKLLISDSESFRQKKVDCSLGALDGPFGSSLVEETGVRHCDSGILLVAVFGK